MMNLAVGEFHDELVAAFQKYLPSGEVKIVEMNMLRFKGRVSITVSLFIDVFYSPRTDKVSFAVLHKEKRIFGIDNLSGWHVHPLGSPHEHVQIAEPSIEAIVMECCSVIKGLVQ
jgi:hypothetical protein